jgi:hypothetical protein
MVTLREALMSYDQAQSDDDREKALKSIQGHCSWNHGHTKPSNLKRIKKANAEEVKGGAEDTSEEEDPDIAHYPTIFKAEEEFSKDVLTNTLINNNNASSIHPVSLVLINSILALLCEFGLLKVHL